MAKVQPLKSSALENIVASVVADRAEEQIAEIGAKAKEVDVRKVVKEISKHKQVDMIRWRCKKDPWFFKQRLVKTIDEHDAENPVKRVPNWPHLPYVTKAIAQHDVILIEKARQVFITWSTLADVLHAALFLDHTRSFVQSKKFEDAAELVSMRTAHGTKFGRGRIKAIYENLPPGLFSDVAWNHGEAAFENGSLIKAIPGGEQQVREHTVTRYFADEAARIPELEDTYIAAKPSIEGGGKIIMATTPRGKEAFYYLIKEFQGTGTVDEPIPGLRIESCPDGVCVITLNWWIVPHRDAAWYARATRGMPPSKARQEYDIDYGVFEGMPVYPQFRRELHVKSLMWRPDLPVIRGWDFGYKRAPVIFCQIVGRNLHILHGVMAKQSSTKMLAEMVVRASHEMYPEANFDDVCDSAGLADRGAGGMSSFEMLESYPFNISPRWRKRKIMSGIDVVSKLLQENRILVNNTPECEPIVDALSGGYAFTQSGEEPKKDGIHDHWMDDLRYVVDCSFEAADDDAPAIPLNEEQVIDRATKEVYTRSERMRREYREYLDISGRGKGRTRRKAPGTRTRRNR